MDDVTESALVSGRSSGGPGGDVPAGTGARPPAPQLTAEQAPARCAHCRARYEPGISWCPQCYAALPVTTPTGTGTGDSAAEAVDEPEAPPSARDGTPGPDGPTAEDLDQVAADLLARLSADIGPGGASPYGVDRLGGLERRLGATATKSLLMAGGSLIVTAVAIGLLYLLAAVTGA